MVSCNIVGVVIATVFFFVLFSVDVTDYQFNFLIVYFFFFCSGNPMGTGAESIVCLSVEWSVMRRIVDERLLSFVMSASGKDD